MSLLRAGSLPWLLVHEARVTWREMTSRTSPAALIGLGLFILGFLHIVFWELITSFSDALAAPVAPQLITFVGLLLIVATPLLLAYGINTSVTAVFERGDLDLLVSSPLPSRTVFAARLINLIITMFVPFMAFLSPFVTVGLLSGMPHLLGVIPLAFVLATTGASLGLLITLALVRLLGARRARTVSQVLGVLAGAALYFIFYGSQVFGFDTQALVQNPQAIAAYFAPGALLGPESLIWYPARVAFFEPLPTLLVLLATVALAVLTTFLVHRSFALGLEAQGSGRGRRRTAGPATGQPAKPATLSLGGETRSFAVNEGSAARLLILNEWRLLLRDPYLISQTFLQLLYLIPVAFILFFDRDAGEPLLGGLAIADLAAIGGIMLLGVLAGSLARITISGEEASDLLVSAPISARSLRRAKLLAALIPVWVLALPILLALVLFGTAGFWLTLFIVAATVGSTLLIALMRLWNPVIVSRQDLFKQNRNGSNTFQNILEAFLPVGFSLAAVGIAMGNFLGWAGMALAVAIPVIAFVRSRDNAGAFEPLDR